MESTLPLSSPSASSPAGAGPRSAEEIEREVRAALDEIGCEALDGAGDAPAAAVSLDASLDDLGLDSIEQVELIGIAWERCGLETGVPMASQVETLRDLIAAATAQLSSRSEGV